jgi:3-hydroxyacyl-CoA dehydrogenase
MTFNSVGILGAGAMGGGIAQVCGLAGLQTTMVEARPAVMISVPRTSSSKR